MTRRNPVFTKANTIQRAPMANILIRPFLNGKYRKDVGGKSFTVEGEIDENPQRLMFEVTQIIENALREAYGIRTED